MRDGRLPRSWLDLPARPQPLRRSLLHLPPAPVAASERSEAAPPYHYSEIIGEASVAGWVFPRDWMFMHDALLDVLFGIQGKLRVKGVFHTDRGWIFFNATRHETAVNSEPPRSDSRLEIISASAFDTGAIEQALLAARGQEAQ
jgi:hypothetical protein